MESHKVGLLIGGALGGAGSLLPWGEISAGFASLSIGGMSEENGYGGIFTLIAALLLVIAAFQSADSLRWLAPAASGGLLLVGISQVVAILTTPFDGGLDASVGVGLWLIAAGGVVAVIAARTETQSQPAPPPSMR